MKRNDAVETLHDFWPRLTPWQRKWLLIQAEIAYFSSKIHKLTTKKRKKAAGHHALHDKHMPGSSP